MEKNPPTTLLKKNVPFASACKDRVYGFVNAMKQRAV